MAEDIGMSRIRQALVSASQLVDRGMPVLGILVREDIFLEAQLEEPGFTGAKVRAVSARGIQEFYVMPLSEEDASRIGIDDLGPLGVVFTVGTREEIEHSLREF
jgi:hypothetical protein